MWFPIELHSISAQRSNLPAAVVAMLNKHPHYHIIDKRQLTNHPCDSSPTGVAATLTTLESCSITYIGTRHSVAIGPFCAFTIDFDLGIAYLEHLIDNKPLVNSQFTEGGLNTLLFGFIYRLFHDQAALSTAVLPLPIAGDLPEGFTQIAMGNCYHINRT